MRDDEAISQRQTKLPFPADDAIPQEGRHSKRSEGSPEGGGAPSQNSGRLFESPSLARNDIAIALSLPPYAGEIAEPYAAPEFLAILANPNALLAGPGAEVLLAGRNTVAAAKAALGERGQIDIVVKSFGSRGLTKFKSLVQPSKAAKAWRGARALVAAGFRTAPPIAYLERRRGGFVSESFFVAGRLAGPLEIRGLLRELRREKLEPLLAALADELARVHDRGLLHRDLSDGNILVEERAFGSPLDRGLNARASRAETDPQAKPGAPAGGESGEPAFRFFFLDTNRIRARRRLGAASRARNLVRLGVPPALQRFFLERYALARGRRLSFGFTLRYRLAKGMFSGWIGFKKKLRLKTLARKLKIQ